MVDMVFRHSNPEHPLRNRIERILAMIPEPATSAGGVQPVRAHKIEQRLRPETIKALCDDYEAGSPTTYLTIKYELGKGTVLNILKQAGIKLRNQGLAPKQLEAATALYLAGWSLVKVGAQFGCDAETIRKELKLAGVTMRKPWERV